MKLSLLFAATTAAAVSFSVLARADDQRFARAYFDSAATHTVVHAAACSFDAASTFDGREHTFDVHVGGERCPDRAIHEGAIPLFVWRKHGDTDRVVVEAAVPADVDARKLQTAIVGITRELQTRVARTPSPAQQQSIAPTPNDTWARASAPSWGNDWSAPRYKRASPGLMAGGILLITAGGLATFGGAVGALSSSGCCGNAGPGLLVLGAGLAGVISGIPMLVMGAKKIPAVTASVSPTGGNLRVTF